MKKKLSAVFTFAICAFIGASFVPGTSEAGYWVRQHAAGCKANTTYIKAGTYGELYYNTTNTNAEAYVYCAITDTNSTPKVDMTTMNVHVYDGTNANEVEATACVKYFGANGGMCGETAKSGVATTGDVTLQPNLYYMSNDYWRYQYGFGYVDVLLPGGTTKSRLNGFYYGG